MSLQLTPLKKHCALLPGWLTNLAGIDPGIARVGRAKLMGWCAGDALRIAFKDAGAGFDAKTRGIPKQKSDSGLFRIG
jgi:hypothetical protein